jgi:hypothetical protein
MIPKSTYYKVKDANGKVLFAGNAKDQRKFYKANGGSQNGLRMTIG